MHRLAAAAVTFVAALAAERAAAGAVFPFGVESVGIQEVAASTVVQPVAVGTFPVIVDVVGGGQLLANYPPANNCIARALNLTRGCADFLKRLDDDGGNLSIMAIKDILALAKTNITSDVNCYNVAASFFNGGCLCDPATIRQIQTFRANPPIPDFAKQAIVNLNRAKCPQPPPPPSNSSSSSSPSSSSPSSPSPSSSSSASASSSQSTPTTTTQVVQTVPTTSVVVDPFASVLVGGRRLKAQASGSQ